METTFGAYFRTMIDDAGITKTKVCEELGVSRPYLYSILDGTTPPPVPFKQMQIAGLLNMSQECRDQFFDLAASERGEVPADIAVYFENGDARERIRSQYIYEWIGLELEKAVSVKYDSKEVHKSSPHPKLRVPCCFQGGKQRVAGEIIDAIFEHCGSLNDGTHFYDLCCGSGAFTVELLNRGIKPSHITMLDISSWGSFWRAIGSGKFDSEKFSSMLEEVPKDKRLVKDYMAGLSNLNAQEDECYRYILLQAASFGGKQIWRDGATWKNAFFRSYWEPTKSSVRKSPANPMQPSPNTLEKRVSDLAKYCKGIECVNDDIRTILKRPIPANSVIYIDPPYRNTTGYAFGFDVDTFISDLRGITSAPIFVSESLPLSSNAFRLKFSGAKGGISGNKHGKHEEWLSCIE